MLEIFRAFKAASEFRRRHLPFLTTLEDLDLVRAIGLGQAAGHPVSLKELFSLGIASVATVQRRLARLRRLGVVDQTRSAHDRRVSKIVLTSKTRKLYAGLARELRKNLK